MNNFIRTAQTLIYGSLISAAIFAFGACNTNSKDTGAATTSKTIADKDGAAADNEKASETSEAIAQSGESAAAKRGDCATWTDVKAAVKAGKIQQVLSSDAAIPELPQGFQKGCVYSDVGAHTFNLIVMKNDARERPILKEANPNALEENKAVYRIIPQFDEFKSEGLMESGKILRVYFDSGMQAEAKAARSSSRAELDEENHQVTFGFLSMESRGVALEEMARLLEATKAQSGSQEEAAAAGGDNEAERYRGVRYSEDKSSLPKGIKSIVLYWLYFDDSGSTDYTVHQVAQNGKNLLWIGLASRHDSFGSPQEWKVVDAVTLPRMSKKEVVANYCSVNGAEDQTILAVYEDLGQGKQTTKVKQAWRFDKRINRLEPVSTRGLVCSGLEEGEV